MRLRFKWFKKIKYKVSVNCLKTDLCFWGRYCLWGKGIIPDPIAIQKNMCHMDSGPSNSVSSLHFLPTICFKFLSLQTDYISTMEVSIFLWKILCLPHFCNIFPEEMWNAWLQFYLFVVWYNKVYSLVGANQRDLFLSKIAVY